MVKIIALASVVLGLASCEKGGLFDKKEKQCPIVTSTDVPAASRSTFSNKYPSATEVIWFNKDNASYVAVFNNNAIETKAVFDLSGNFVSEEVDNNVDNEADDENEDEDDDKGCRCELDDDED